MNIVVTVPGNTRFYIVLGTGSGGRETGSRQAAMSVPVGSKATTMPTLEELRQLIQLRQELSAMHQQASTPAAASQTPQ
jgi:16S rRNA G966 N2-methylase RsmD